MCRNTRKHQSHTQNPLSHCLTISAPSLSPPHTRIHETHTYARNSHIHTHSKMKKHIIINNGFFPKSFNIEDKDYLSHYIQSNKHIKGISLEHDEEIKQSLLADDATYFLNDSSDSFNNLIESLTL
ncbi:hypothetical protein DPMN_129659 [Dreissena polymorpha]|uniref:Uncharacterized protein n=1 Tax=Dreissena polymorpha TaxID=45954 RepID=A0A9D4K172_DREPO|nr:hypothetical protein DPMN_129659 [Dreissena polymorpha]